MFIILSTLEKAKEWASDCREDESVEIFDANNRMVYSINKRNGLNETFKGK